MNQELLLQRVRGRDNSGGSVPVRNCVKRCRRNLGDEPDDPINILTKRRVGYWVGTARRSGRPSHHNE